MEMLSPPCKLAISLEKLATCLVIFVRGFDQLTCLFGPKSFYKQQYYIKELVVYLANWAGWKKVGKRKG